MAPLQSAAASLTSLEKDLEKTVHIENATNKYAHFGLSADQTEFYEDFKGTPKHPKLLRKIDPPVADAVVPCRLSGPLFFILYILGEVPSIILLKRFKRPSWYLGTLTVLWGIVMTSTGAVTNFGQLVACMVLLGVFERGFFPDGGRLSGEAQHELRLGLLWELVTDVKVWMQAFILFSMGAVTYGLKFTMPSITTSMGYCSTHAQLLSVPPYIAGPIASVGLAWLSDRYQWRLPFIFDPSLTIVVGFAILIPLAPNISNNIPACYIALVFICIGQYPFNTASYGWTGANLAGDAKHATGMALHISLGNCGGIVGSYMFLDSEAPGYPTGFGIGLGLCAAACVVAIVLEVLYKSLNCKRDQMTEEEVHAKYSNEQLWRMGNMSPLFQYKL